MHAYMCKQRCGNFSKLRSKAFYPTVNMSLRTLFGEKSMLSERRRVDRLCARRKIFSTLRCEIPASISPESRTVRWRNLTVKRRNGAHREEGASGRVGGRGKFTLAATLRECTPGRSCAAAATDPPTPTGDEKGRENERGEPESRCGASRLSRAAEKERERERDRGEKEKEERGLDAEISVTCSLCEDFNAARRWKSNKG